MRITITLMPIESEVLWALAQREHRDPRDQAAFLIRAELTRRGLLSADPMPTEMQSAHVDETGR